MFLQKQDFESTKSIEKLNNLIMGNNTSNNIANININYNNQVCYEIKNPELNANMQFLINKNVSDMDNMRNMSSNLRPNFNETNYMSQKHPMKMSTDFIKHKLE